MNLPLEPPVAPRALTAEEFRAFENRGRQHSSLSSLALLCKAAGAGRCTHAPDLRKRAVLSKTAILHHGSLSVIRPAMSVSDIHKTRGFTQVWPMP